MDALFATFVIALILIAYIVLKCYKECSCEDYDCFGIGYIIDLQFTVGGHTSEMISLIRNLNSSQFAPIVFVHADTDTKSPIYLAESSVVVFLMYFM